MKKKKTKTKTKTKKTQLFRDRAHLSSGCRATARFVLLNLIDLGRMKGLVGHGTT